MLKFRLVNIFIFLTISGYSQTRIPQEELWTLTRVYGAIKYYNNEKDDSYLDAELVKILPKLKNPEYRVKKFNTDIRNLFPSDERVVKSGEEIINPFDQFKDNDHKCIVDFSWIDGDKLLSEENKKLLWQLIHTHKKISNSNIRKEGTFIHKENKIPTSLTESDQYLLGVIKYWNVIEYFFPYKPLMDEHWDTIYYKAIPDLLSIESDKDYLKSLKKLTAKLDDTHAYVDESERINDINVSKLPFSIAIVKDQLVIISLNDSLSNLYGVKNGDVIEMIDGKNFNDLWEEFSETNAYSTPQAGRNELKLYLWHRFNYNDSTVQVRIRSNNIIHKESIKMIGLKDFISLKPRSQENEPFRSINDKIGYIAYDDLSYSDLGKAIRKLKRKNYLILDCRGYNYGFSHLRLLNFLGNKHVSFAKVYQPNYKYPGIFDEPKEIKHRFLPKLRSTYKGNLIVLINEENYSAMESLLMAIKIRRSNAVFIGSTTQGCVGQRYGVDLPSHRKVWFTGLGDWQYPDGSQFQRIGIRPEIFIEPTVESIKNGEDLVLNKAIGYINELSSK
jgi:C-terminal processing protease CtpA/Prc